MGQIASIGWQSWIVIGITITISLTIISLLIVKLSLNGFKIKKGKMGIEIDSNNSDDTHECKQIELLQKMAESQEIVLEGLSALLKWSIKSGANGNTEEIADNVDNYSKNWKMFLLKRGINK